MTKLTHGGTVTVDLDGRYSTDTGIALGDNQKATFGDSNDLQIYHDGSNSRIREAGTGSLLLDAENLYLRNTTGDSYFQGLNGGAANVFYNGSVKLTTTTTGIDVTGTVTADGLIVDGTDSLRSSADDSLINISGGNATNSGANYALFGETHASLAGVHRWRTDGNERMRIDSSGNVGIGTTSPASHLEIRGSSGGNDKQLRLSTGSTTYWDLGRSGVNGNFEITEDSGNTYFVIDKTLGNVGIGTTSPKQQLHISGGSSSGDVTKVTIGATGTNAETHLQLAENFSGNDMHYGFSFVTDGNDTNNLLIKSHNNSTTGTTALSVARATGNVGIGTTSPAGKLEVSSADFDTLYLTRSTAGSATILMKNSSNNGGLVQSLGNGGLSFFSTVSDSSSERMRIDASGNVGIGITNPSSYWAQADNLVVGGTGNDGITIKSATVGNGRIAFTDTASSTAGLNDGGLISYSHNDDALSFQTSGSERLRINSSGKKSLILVLN
jgi:hypothetical protein